MIARGAARRTQRPATLVGYVLGCLIGTAGPYSRNSVRTRLLPRRQSSRFGIGGPLGTPVINVQRWSTLVNCDSSAIGHMHPAVALSVKTAGSGTVRLSSQAPRVSLRQLHLPVGLWIYAPLSCIRAGVGSMFGEP